MYLTLKTGNLEKEVHIRQRKVVPAAGSTLQLMPTENSNSEVYEINYFCLTGEVDESAKIGSVCILP